MALILFIVIVSVLLFFPVVRCAVFNPVAVVVYGIKDIFKYFSRHQNNFCGCGELVAYVGLFGRGKTLSAVHKVTSMYRHFDGKKVWCPRRQRIVSQRIKIISNVDLKNVPYERLESLKQVVMAAKGQQAYDDEHNTLTVTLVIGDEFSVQMNSRNFRTNIDPLFLNALLTCRHYYLSIYYTAQRFSHVDALLRQVTSYVVDCSKVWRFQRLAAYDAWDLENASNAKLVTPLSRSCWFVRDSDYAAFDTLAVVDNLEREVEKGQMLTPEQILSLQRNQPNMNVVSKPSKGWFRRFGGRQK